MAEADIATIGLAYDTSQLLTGSRQVQDALRQLEQAEKSAQTATKALEQSSTQAAAAFAQERTAASQAAQGTQQLAQASGQAASALTQTASAASRAAQATAQVGQQAQTAAGHVTRLASAAGDFGRQVGAFALAQAGVQSLQSALSSVLDFGRASVQAAVQTESLRAAFKAIEGSSQAAGQTMQWLKDQANRLGVDVVALSTGFKTVDAAARGTSLQGEGIRKVFTAMAEASRVLGLSSQDVNGVLLAVGQSISKGTVQAEELRGQIGERLPGAFQIAARAMGVTTQELDKMMERGELQATTFWPRFADTIRREFGGSVEEASKTAGAAFERFHNTMREFQVNVGQTIIPALTWIVANFNAVIGAANKAAQAIAEVGKAGRDAAAESQRLAGGKDVATDLQRQRNAAVAEEAAARAARIGAGAIAGQRSPQYAAAQERENAAIAKRIDLDRQLATASQAAQRAGDPLGEGPEVEPGSRDEKRVAFQQKLVDQVKANRDELEKLDRVTRQLYGRAPSENEILKVKEKQVEVTRKLIDSDQQLWNLYKDTGPAKELRAQAAGAEALEKSIKAAAETGRTGKKEAAEAAREEEQLRKEALADTQAKGKAIYEQDSDAVQLLSELQRRTEALGMTEEERFQQRARAMAEEHPALQQLIEDELARYEAAQRTNEALKDRPRRLQEEAAASKGRLDEINRLMQQFEPGRRGESTEERLMRSYAALSQAPGVTGLQLIQASEKMQAALDTEEWQRWEEFGLASLEKVGDAITQFAFHGKLTFKDMVSSIAEDFFRLSMQTVMQSAMGSGGWLQKGLDLGLKVLGIAGGAASGTLPTTWGQYTTMAAAGAFSGRQGGGPVQAGVPYIVGEKGPELYVPKMSGTILPNGQLSGGPTVINVNVHGVTDATSFIQSQGAVQRAVARTVSASYRGL